MDETRFWEIIDATVRTSEGDKNAQRDQLIALLRQETDDDLRTWETIFYRFKGALYRRDIWDAAVYIYGGCSDDFFMDFRDYLISCGSTVYQAVLKHADNIYDYPSLLEYGEDYFGHCAAEAFKENGGVGRLVEMLGDAWPELDDSQHIPRDRDHIATHYPKLYAYLEANDELDDYFED